MTTNQVLSFLGAAAVVCVGYGCDAGSVDETDPGEGAGGGAVSSGGGGMGTAMGGADGTGGIAIDPQNMIDDLDDGDASIKAAGGRIGAWYTYNDETVGASQTPDAAESFTPEEGGPDGSVYCAHTSGSGFTEWGAGMGVDLNNPGDGMGGPGVKGLYDGSAFSGIAFVAKGSGAVRMKVLVDAIVPTDEGGSCDAECTDAHGAIVALTADWNQHVISYDELFQEGWGASASFDPTTIMGIQFQVTAGTEFDFYVDELGFY